MKRIHENIKKGEIKLKPENQDDLWYLSNLIDVKDIVKAKTLRKIKLGEEGERSSKVVKKAVTLSVAVEKIELGQQALRISGIIAEGTDDIPKGDHHTITIEPNDELMVIKEKWLSYQLDKVKEACNAKAPNILIVVHDREEAIFALTKKQGYEVLSHLKGDVQKKEEKASHKEGFYTEVLKKVDEYISRHKIEHVIISSPAFFKEDLMKQVGEEELKKKIVLATCSSVSENAVNEVLKRTEVKQVLMQEQTSKELALIEELLAEISKNGKATYGFNEVKKAAEAGAVDKLMISDKLIVKLREEGTFEELDDVMKIVDSNKGLIKIVNSTNDAGKKLDGLGGIGAVLRYKIDY